MVIITTQRRFIDLQKVAGHCRPAPGYDMRLRQIPLDVQSGSESAPAKKEPSAKCRGLHIDLLSDWKAQQSHELKQKGCHPRALLIDLIL